MKKPMSSDSKKDTAKEAARLTGPVGAGKYPKNKNVIGSSKGRVTGSNKIAVDYAVGNKRYTKNYNVFSSGPDRNTTLAPDKRATTKGRPRNPKGKNKNVNKKLY